MSMLKGRGKAAFVSDPKGKNVAEFSKELRNSEVSQLTHEMGRSSINFHTGDDFIFPGRKSRCRGGFASDKQLGNTGSSNPNQKQWVDSRNSSGNVWGQRTECFVAGRGHLRPQNETNAREPEFRAPVVSGQPKSCQRWADLVSPPGIEMEKDHPKDAFYDDNNNDDNDSLDDEDDDDDNDDPSDDSYSDEDEKSHETLKQSKWCRSLFEILDNLSVEQINEPTRQWHCPVCHGGPGGIDWYKGLQPLISHAKTKGSTKVKKHRLLGTLLEEELKRRGTSVIPAGEQYGKWTGLKEETIDHQIIWPPMVVILNTTLHKDEDDKWIGMGNQELIDYFSSYGPSKARHSYGPGGNHRGLSLLIFDNSAIGYMAAERLHRHFIEQGTGREAWDRPGRSLFAPGGMRQLYGFMATKEDLEMFNRHCHGKSRMKYEIKSYHQMVVLPMKKMNEDNQQLNYLKNKVVKTEQRSKVYEETLGVVSQKLRETMEENRIVKMRTQDYHEESKEAMDYQEKFFSEQIELSHKLLEERERLYEETLQNELNKAREFGIWSAGTNEDSSRKKSAERFIDSQLKDVQDYEAAREELKRRHEEKQVKLHHEYLSNKCALEQEFAAELTRLMQKYKPDSFDEPSNSGAKCAQECLLAAGGLVVGDRSS